MSPWLTLLILAVAQPAPTAVSRGSAQEVYRYGFEQSTDFNFEPLPAGWTRKQGPGHPRYLPVKVSFEPSPEGRRCLKAELDGGAAAVFSPAVPADADHCWLAEVQVRTERLVHDRARLRLVFLDAERRVLESIASPAVQSPGAWQMLRVGPVAPQSSEVRWVQIELALEPSEQKFDLVGSARFDDVWLGQIPRVRLDTADRERLYRAGQAITIDCQATGFAKEPPAIELELVDALGQSIDAPASEMLPANKPDLNAETSKPSTKKSTELALALDSPVGGAAASLAAELGSDVGSPGTELEFAL